MSPIDLEALEAAYERGLAAERAGDEAAAAAAWRDCLALDPEDRGGAAVRLAALGQGPSPERASPLYVATLFDQHAESFEATLVLSLGYAIPERIAETLSALGLGPFARGLDLGCGTGLAAEALEDRVEAMEGVDLSEGMLEIAAEKDVYAGLFAGDAVAFLGGADKGAYDLVVAADVLPYFGEIEPLFDGLAHVLAPGGVAVFSTETLPAAAFEGTPGWRVGPRQRYAHDPAMLEAALLARGLGLLSAAPVTVRYETGVPVPGHLVVARRND
ncbi:MAG: methyltransferase domain-containing protein [Pseudomonadota bacterium]